MTEEEKKKTEQRVMTAEEILAEINICVLNNWRIRNIMNNAQFAMEKYRDSRRYVS